MANEVKNETKVERYIVGSPWWRALAFLIDLIIFYALVYGLYYLVLAKIFPTLSNDVLFTLPYELQKRYMAFAFVGLGLPAGFIVFCLPALLFKKGKTLGKKICKLQTISKDGTEIKFFHLFFRFMVGIYAIEYVPMCFIIGIPFPLIYVISGLIAFANPKHVAIHDFVSGTLVVEDNKTEVTLKTEEIEKEEIKDEENKPTNIKVR